VQRRVASRHQHRLLSSAGRPQTRRAARPPARTLYVGLEVHQKASAGASVAHDHGAAGISLGTLGTRQGAMAQRSRPLQSTSTPRVFVSAAGPYGSWLARSLTNPGDVCGVVAPAWIPHKAGARVKPARREAMPLARLLRAGDRTPVPVPAIDAAARRDRRRAREETLRARQAAQRRLQAGWLRHASRSPGRANWSPAHLRWLSEVVCPTPAQQIIF